MIKTLLRTILLSLFFVAFTSAQVTSIKNGALWYDTNGNLIQAHGASIMKHEGVYYMLGEDKSISSFKGVNLYSSTDLMNWEFRNAIIDRNTNSHLANLQRITERPCLIYNAKDNRFVVWLKYQNGSYTNNKAAIFYCNTIDGKYTYVKEFFPGGYDSNDCSFFVDDDGTAYYISTCKEFNSLNLYKLSADYMDVESSTILSRNEAREAPVIMKKGNIYYLLSSGKSGWDPNPLQYCTSTSLTEGWSSRRTIGDRMSYDSQPTCYLQITGTEGTSYFYVGDRWKDPVNSEAKTVIYPLTLNNGNIDIDYVYEFKIDLEKGTWAAFDDNEYISQNNWSIVSSTGGIGGSNIANRAIDNNPNTFWQTSGNTAHPHEIVIDLGSNETVSGFKYVQRNDDQIYGIVKEYRLYLSDDVSNWGNPVSQGWMSYTTEKTFQATTARYMRFVAESEHGRWGNTKYASAAELKLIMEKPSISQSGWTLHSTDSEAGGSNPATFAFDGNNATFWHTPWGSLQTYYPHYLAINLGASYDINGLKYLPRQDASVNGTISKYEIYVSADGVNWGTAVASGTWPSTNNEKIVQFEAKTGQYIKLVGLSEINNNAFASAAEINVYGVKAGSTDVKQLTFGNTEPQVIIYPNPAKSVFNISLPEMKTAMVSIYDIKGRLVFETISEDEEQDLHFSKGSVFKTGLYIVKVIGDNSKIYHQKLVID